MLGVIGLAACTRADAGAPPVPPSPPPAPVKPAPAPTRPAPPPRTPAPAPPPGFDPTLRPSYPVGAIHIPCKVRAEIQPTIVGKDLRLRFTLVNISGQAVTVKLRGTRIGGLVQVNGLPAGFDPMRTCRVVGGRNPSTTRELVIPAGRKPVVIGQTTLRGRGDACNPALPLGSSFLTAQVDSIDNAFEVCSGPAIHIVRANNGALRKARVGDPPVTAPRAAPPPAPPAKTPQTKPAPTKPPPASCPTCGFGCLHGTPSTRVDANGCPVCGCDDLDLRP